VSANGITAIENASGILAGGDIRINRAGIYLVTGGAKLTNPSNAGVYSGRILVIPDADPTNPFGICYDQVYGPMGDQPVLRGSELIRLAVDDVLEIQANQTGGGAGVQFVGGINATSGATIIKLVWIGT
jgi:hypothetical protein